MKTSFFFALTLALAPMLRAADTPAAEVKAAIKKLSEAANYSWTTSSPAPEGGARGFGGGSSEGKTEKDGCAVVKRGTGDRAMESVFKAGKVALKTPEGWKSGEELAAAPRPEAGGGGGGRGRGFGGGGFAAAMAQNFKAPAAEAEALATGVKELKKDGDTISGDLTEEAAKARLTFGGGGARRGGADRPGPTDAKGNVKFWVKDGVLAKYEVSVEGKMEGNNGPRDIKRTNTTEIKDVGTTKLEVPAEATAKLSGGKPAETKPAADTKKADATKPESK